MDRKPARIIILSGQSNAVGVGYVNCLSKHFTQKKITEYCKGYDNIKINFYSHNIKSNGFVPVTVGCAEKDKATLGPEVGMAEYLNESLPGEEFFIVKCAFGGTSICGGDWRSPSMGEIGDYEETKDCSIGGVRKAGWCYNELIHILGKSIEMLEGQRYAPTFSAFCWMQGESDACSADATDRYTDAYDCLIGDIVSRYPKQFEGCIFIDGAIAAHWPYAAKMNEGKKKYADASLDRRYIDTIGAGLTTFNEPESAPDTAHYDSDSVIKLGRMFAEAIGF